MNIVLDGYETVIVSGFCFAIATLIAAALALTPIKRADR